MKKALFLVLLGAFFWGTLPVFSRVAYASGSDPLTAAAWRCYLAAIVFVAIFLVRGTFKTIKLREVPFYIVYGVLGVGGTFVFYMLALEQLSTAMAAMLLYTAPAFVILLSRLFYKEPITRTKVVALLCTFGGCFLVVRGYDISALTASFGSILIGLASGFSYSMLTVMGRVALKKHDSQTNAGLMVLFGTLVFLIIRPPWRLAAPTPILWGSYIGLALFGSVFSYLAYLGGLAKGLDGGIASIAATFEPVVATLFGVFVFGDVLEIWQVLGILVVLCGVALPFVLRKKPRPAPRE